MKKQSIHSRLINSYLLLTDRKSKYQERWFYSNPIEAQPSKHVHNRCAVKKIVVQNRNIWEISPKKGLSERSILFLHGGAFAKNIQSFHWRFIERISNALNAKVFTVDYPLLPEATNHEVHQFIIECYKELSIEQNIAELTVIGDSAGATLAINTAHLLNEEGLSQPKEFILLSPWLDLSLANPLIDTVNQIDPLLDKQVLQKLGTKFAAELEPNDVTISPIYQDLRRIAPITVFIGTRDIMLADCRKLKNMSSSLPTVFTYREFEGMFHGWMYFDFPEGKSACEMIINHIKHEPSEFELAMQENEFGW